MIELAEFCGGVLPGVKTIEYVPIAWIDRESYTKLINSNNNWQHELPFVSGTWLKAPIIPIGDFVEENNKKSSAGPYWEVKISGRTLKMKPISTGTLSNMSRHRFVLRITSKEGTPWIIGSLNAPLSFSYKAALDGSKNRYDIEWNAEIPHSIHGYIPTL